MRVTPKGWGAAGSGLGKEVGNVAAANNGEKTRTEAGPEILARNGTAGFKVVKIWQKSATVQYHSSSRVASHHQRRERPGRRVDVLGKAIERPKLRKSSYVSPVWSMWRVLWRLLECSSAREQLQEALRPGEKNPHGSSKMQLESIIRHHFELNASERLEVDPPWAQPIPGLGNKGYRTGTGML